MECTDRDEQTPSADGWPTQSRILLVWGSFEWARPSDNAFVSCPEIEHKIGLESATARDVGCI